MNPQRQAHRGELDHPQEVLRPLVVSGDDASEVLELGEEALDQVALTIEPAVWPSWV